MHHIRHVISSTVVLFLVVTAVAKPHIKEYRTSYCAFRYPADFKPSVTDLSTTFHLALINRSKYWENTITIRKLNKKTEECDIPQDSHPDTDEKRKIAGHRAYGYSGEDAAMNRYTKEQGYLIETRTDCWRFELVRQGRPYQKLNLPSEEMKRLDKQSDQDSKKANVAFKMVLDSFAFRRK